MYSRGRIFGLAGNELDLSQERGSLQFSHIHCSSCLAGNELVPSLTKHTASVVFIKCIQSAQLKGFCFLINHRYENMNTFINVIDLQTHICSYMFYNIDPLDSTQRRVINIVLSSLFRMKLLMEQLFHTFAKQKLSFRMKFRKTLKPLSKFYNSKKGPLFQQNFFLFVHAKGFPKTSLRAREQQHITFMKTLTKSCSFVQ